MLNPQTTVLNSSGPMKFQSHPQRGMFRKRIQRESVKTVFDQEIVHIITEASELIQSSGKKDLKFIMLLKNKLQSLVLTVKLLDERLATELSQLILDIAEYSHEEYPRSNEFTLGPLLLEGLELLSKFVKDPESAHSQMKIRKFFEDYTTVD